MRPPDDELRSRAITILKKRRDFRAHLLIYVLVNGALVTVWAVTNPDVFFWPVFPLVFWGIGVVMNAWDAYFANDFSEEKIEREMRRLQPH
jgi:predicted membrane channel-forming protein YqfA (hemolysin III family)